MDDVESETRAPTLPTNAAARNSGSVEEISEHGEQTLGSAIGLDPSSSSLPTASQEATDTIPGTQDRDSNRGLFDEPGYELGACARVWKTYVKEATKHDFELAGEWNRTLDVMLIFAALFSAIVTTLLNESSKKLQEDYSQTSAQTLLLISQTLIAIANTQQTLETLAQPQVAQPFRPRQMDRYVNTLWFTSLSLSVLVSFICILAKEWCFNFLSGNPEEPHPQARKRQIRWNGISKWRLRQLMIILPSIMHLALLMFTAGLCISLWSVSFSVALPVAIISVGIMLVYLLATLFHLISDKCPYSTAASRIIQSCFGKSKMMEDDYYEQDKVTSQSVAWLIKTSKNRASVDTALQSIAGADKNLPRQPLLRCGAVNLITTRLKILGDDYAKDHTRAYIRSLYIRALRFLESSPPSNKDEQKQVDLESKLKSKIRYLRRLLESTVARHVALSDSTANATLSSGTNVGSLKAATRALAESLWVRDNGIDNSPDQSSILEDVTNQLEFYEREPSTFHPASGVAVIVGAATLYACIPRSQESDSVVRYVLRALPKSGRLPNKYLGMILAPFALARHEKSKRSERTTLIETSQVLTAVETILFYLPILGDLDENTATTMIEFGLAHLLHNATAYNLSVSELELIHAAFTRLPNNNIVRIEGLPSSFNVRQYALDSIALVPAHRSSYSSSSPQEFIHASRTAIGVGTIHHNEGGQLTIRSSSSAGMDKSGYIELAIKLLQELGKSPHQVAEYCIVVTLVQLFPKFLPSCEEPTVMELAALLLAEKNRLRNQHLGLLLAVFVLSTNKNAVDSAAGETDSINGVSQALRVGSHYIPLLNQLDDAVSNVMVNFGIVELLKVLGIDEQQYLSSEYVYASFKRFASSDYHITAFEGTPLGFNIHDHIAEALTQILLGVNDKKDVAISRITALRHLNALRRIYYSGQAIASRGTGSNSAIPPEVHTLGSSISSLQLFEENQDRIPASVGFSLVFGAVMLFSSAAADCTMTLAANYLKRTLMKGSDLPTHYLGILSMAFTLGWNGAIFSQSIGPGITTRFAPLRAIECVSEYARASASHRNNVSEAINLAVTTLILNSSAYQIPTTQVEGLYRAFLALPTNGPTSLYAPPHDFDIDQFITNALTSRLISVCKQHDAPAAQAAATIHLNALSIIYKTQLEQSPQSISSQLVAELGTQDIQDLSRLEYAFAQLDRVRHNPALLKPSLTRSLAVSGATLLALSLPQSESRTASRLLIQLLAGEHQLSHECLGILLLVFALSANNPPGWSGPPLHPKARVMRALDTIVHYAPELEKIPRDQSTTMINIGLLELLLNASRYELSEQDLTALYRAFIPPNHGSASHTIHQLSPSFDTRLYILESFTRKLSTASGSTQIDLTEDEGKIFTFPAVTIPETQTGSTPPEARDDQLGTSERGRGDRFLVSWDGPNDPSNPMNWSRGRRWFVTMLGSVVVINTAFSCTAPFGIQGKLIEEFGISTLIAILSISLFLVGRIMGWLLLSHQFWRCRRRPVLLLHSASYTAFQIGCAFAPNIESLLIFRFLSGVMAGCQLTTFQAIVTDIWDINRRAGVVSMVNISMLVGSASGPIITGHLGNGNIDWRWLFRGLSIFTSVYTVILALVLPETYESGILKKRAIGLRRSTGDDRYYTESWPMMGWFFRWKTLLWGVVVHFREPEFSVITVYTSFVYGCMHSPFASYPIVFVQGHGLNNGTLGLMFLPLLGGGIVGIGIYLIIFGRNLRSRGLSRYALCVTAGAGLCYAVSFFWFGWTSYPSISYFAPAFSGALSGASAVLIVLSLHNHMIHTYDYNGITGAAYSGLIQSAFTGGFLPIAIIMYQELNPRIASTILGAIAFAMVPIPFALLYFRDWFRIHSPYLSSLRDSTDSIGAVQSRTHR